MTPHVPVAAPSGAALRPAFIALAMTASLVLAACGGGNDSNDPASAPAAETSDSTVAASAPSPATVLVSVPDTYAVTSVTWNTKDTTRYELKTSADLGLQPQSMNSKGVVGGTFDTDHGQYAALWQDGQVQTLMPLVTWGPVGCNKACSGAVSKVDEQGNAYITPASYGNASPPMTLVRHGATSAETLTDCLRVYAINDAGQFLCDQWTGPHQYDTRSAMWTLQGLGKTVLSGGETAMNPAGTIAGSFRQDLLDGTHRYIFQQKGAHFTFLELPGIQSAEVLSINAQDVVIGRIELPGDNSSTSYDRSHARPFMWKDGRLTMLPCPQAYGMPTSINRDGTIAGGCYLAGDTPETEMKSIAVLWKDGQLVDVTAHLHDAAGWTLVGSWAINDLGWMLASGYRGNDPTALEAVLLRPMQP